MNKSLGNYNIKKSSSHDIRNIVWTMKNRMNVEKSKNKKNNSDKKFQNSFTNIIYDNEPKMKSHFGKIFKIKKNYQC